MVKIRPSYGLMNFLWICTAWMAAWVVKDFSINITWF